MKDKFDELDEELNLDEVEDFEAKPAMYQVWVLGYNEKQEITDFDVFINESQDPDKAVDYAKQFIIEERFKTLSIPEDVCFLSVEVEEVADFGDHTENVGTLFSDTVKIN